MPWTFYGCHAMLLICYCVICHAGEIPGGTMDEGSDDLSRLSIEDLKPRSWTGGSRGQPAAPMKKTRKWAPEWRPARAVALAARAAALKHKVESWAHERPPGWLYQPGLKPYLYLLLQPEPGSIRSLRRRIQGEESACHFFPKICQDLEASHLSKCFKRLATSSFYLLSVV